MKFEIYVYESYLMKNKVVRILEPYLVLEILHLKYFKYLVIIITKQMTHTTLFSLPLPACGNKYNSLIEFETFSNLNY